MCSETTYPLWDLSEHGRRPLALEDRLPSFPERDKVIPYPGGQWKFQTVSGDGSWEPTRLPHNYSIGASGNFRCSEQITFFCDTGETYSVLVSTGVRFHPILKLLWAFRELTGQLPLPPLWIVVYTRLPFPRCLYGNTKVPHPSNWKRYTLSTQSHSKIQIIGNLGPSC